MPPKKRKRTDEDETFAFEKVQNKKSKQFLSEASGSAEKRGAILKKRCPKVIMDRVERVMSQRFFMVGRSRDGNELREEFSVLGSTGNVYTVIIDRIPFCDCPDATKGNHCKHILFIFLKVLQVPTESHCWYQKALLTSELEVIFAQAPKAPTAVANRNVVDAYNRATGKASSSTAVDPPKNRRMPGADDDCPVCYEEMHNVDMKTLTFCNECGNALHNECFQQWARKAGHNVTCVWCRAKWVYQQTAAAGGSSPAAARSSEGYINLSGVAGVSPVRDTSTYYHGPGRWRGYY